MATSRLKAREPKAQKVGHFKGVAYGKQGGGKSWFALQLPRPYYIDVEEGSEREQYQARLLQAGGKYMDRGDGAGSFEVVIDQVKALAAEDHPFQTLVIDSLTKLTMIENASERERIGSNDPFSSYKKAGVAKTMRLLDAISKLDMNVVLIAHEIPEWQTIDGKREQTGVMPDCYDKVSYELDLTLRILLTSKGNRVAQIGKSRILGFPEGDRFNLQVNGTDTSYEEFAKRYGKDALEGPRTPTVFATPEQIAEIERLLALLKPDADEVKKKLVACKAETWSDLTSEQADAAINKWLKKKLETPKEGDK